jgi:Arc/MetJ family transcription regulator
MKWAILVRTNIDIDDRLMRQAMRHSGARTKKATVEAGLRLLVDTHAQGAIRRLKGKVRWEGNLNESRQGRVRE